MIEVKTWLREETYKAWYARAQREGTTVAVLLATAADRAAAPREPKARKWVRVTAEMKIQIADLHRLGYGPTAIAREVGISVGSVANHLPKGQG